MYCNQQPTAKAIIKGSPDCPKIRGEVLFFQQRCAVLLSASIAGLPQNETGFFAFHLHEGGSCDGAGFSQTGGHFNPGEEPHPQHAGSCRW